MQPWTQAKLMGCGSLWPSHFLGAHGRFSCKPCALYKPRRKGRTRAPRVICPGFLPVAHWVDNAVLHIGVKMFLIKGNRREAVE